MTRRCSFALPFLFAVAFTVVAAPRPAAAEVSPFLTFSARLATTAGVPVDGPQQLRFRIYSAAEGGNELWTEAATVEVQDGFAYHPLGSSTNFPVDLFRSPSLYLEVSVGSEMFRPRLGLTSVPFAMHAADALTADEAQHAIDADHATTADNSLMLGGLAPGSWQRATTAACNPGSFLSSISPSGTAACTAAAVSAGDISAVTTAAGSGLLGGAASGDVSLAVDPSQFQRRVAATCSPGEAIQSISATGTVTCEVDTDTNTTYTGSSPITVAGTSIGLSSAGCVNGDVWKFNGSAWSCDPDASGSGTITGVTAGTGLTGGGTSGAVTVNANPAYLQRRVSACGANSSIRSINEDGTVVCEADTDTDSAAGRVLYSGCEWVNQVGTGQSVQVNCPAGKVAVSGGCYGGNNNNQYLRRSVPAGGYAGWFCGFNVGDPDSTAYANCCHHY